MANALQKELSLDRLRAFVLGRIAALNALGRIGELNVPGLEAAAQPWLPALVARWGDVLAEVDDALVQLGTRSDHQQATGVVERVLEVAWDESVRSLSSVALTLSGEDPDRPPYADLFGSVPPDDLARFGPAKATTAGVHLVEKARALGHPQLLPLAEALDRQTKALASAAEDDRAAETGCATADVERLNLLRRTSLLVAETEAELLERLPGHHALVDAVLDSPGAE